MTAPRPLPRAHPKLAAVYRRQVERLEEPLNDPAIRPEATDALRALIDRIVIHPKEGRGEVEVELYGELAAILALGETMEKDRTSGGGVRLSMVAGARYPLYRKILWLRRGRLVSG